MWFKKKDKQEAIPLGELPELPDLPDFPEIKSVEKPSNIKEKLPEFGEREELPALPSFPNSSIAERISQEAIKSELSSSIKPYTKEISPEHKEERRRVSEIYPKQESQPIFVRIDRFQNSLKNFNEVKKQLQEIESYLSDIREIRAKEDTELSEWEKELHEIKMKLESIDSVLFSKLEK